MARARAEDYAEKQQRIRERAAELFAARGFEATSAADIAAEGGFSKALIYHYFASKEEILQDLLEAHMDALHDAVEEARRNAPEDPRERLRAFVRAHMRLYATSRAKHLLLINELTSLPPRGRAAIVAKQRKLIGLAADLFAEIAPALKIQAELRVPTTMSFYGMINWTCIWYRPDGALTPDAFADLACDLFLDGLAGRFGVSTLPRTGRSRST
jgi:AcrR family transcriptional regulator